ncbi:MAG: hypothetical protein WKF75_04280 [Singulisphaera sp.]
MPEVSVLRPGDVPAREPDGQSKSSSVILTYRNIAEVDVKVYPVDLPYLTHRNLNAITGIDLVGSSPWSRPRSTCRRGRFRREALDLPEGRESLPGDGPGRNVHVGNRAGVAPGSGGPRGRGPAGSG